MHATKVFFAGELTCLIFAKEGVDTLLQVGASFAGAWVRVPLLQVHGCSFAGGHSLICRWALFCTWALLRTWVLFRELSDHTKLKCCKL